MLKKKYISWVMLLIVLVTLFNLFYKHRLWAAQPVLKSLQMILNPVTKITCPLHGFKCPTHEPCDCDKYCTNGANFVKFRVTDQDHPIYVLDKQLVPGTYCLPKGIHICNNTTSIAIFSLAGWACFPSNTTLFEKDFKIACKHDEAENNDLNVLWDTLLNQPAAENILNLYERTKGGGAYRYQCKCGSKSLMKNTPMVSPLPFICEVDYCLRDIPDPLLVMGWNGTGCDCATYEHLDDEDPTSPCVVEKTRVKRNLLTGRVDCMSRDSLIRRALLCPEEQVMWFTIPVEGENLRTEKYMDSIIQPQELGRKKNRELENYFISKKVDE